MFPQTCGPISGTIYFGCGNSNRVRPVCSSTYIHDFINENKIYEYVLKLIIIINFTCQNNLYVAIKI